MDDYQETLDRLVNTFKYAFERCCEIINNFVEDMRKLLYDANEEAEDEHYKKHCRSCWKLDKHIANKKAMNKYKTYQMRYKSHLDKGKRRFHR